MPVVCASFTRGPLLSKKARLGRACCYFLYSCLAERAVMKDKSSVVSIFDVLRSPLEFLACKLNL
jgi:hypothetical protein